MTKEPLPNEDLVNKYVRMYGPVIAFGLLKEVSLNGYKLNPSLVSRGNNLVPGLFYISKQDKRIPYELAKGCVIEVIDNGEKVLKEGYASTVIDSIVQLESKKRELNDKGIKDKNIDRVIDEKINELKEELSDFLKDN